MTPRVLAVMGSGETGASMTTAHRSLIDRLGQNVNAIALDTPFGFQMNADDLVARTIEYFRTAVQRPIEFASYRSSSVDPIDAEIAFSKLRKGDYLFAGPGSPTYALDQWRDSPVPEILRSKLETGGCVAFASAAALTLGAFTLPVYEVYKVGQAPMWRDGLDLLSVAGLEAAVVPHFNNGEGGTHDTRYCYMGETRFRALRDELPDEAVVLGVDEHTTAVLDLAEDRLSVMGVGGVTLISGGSTEVLKGSDEVPLAKLRAGPDRARDRTTPERPDTNSIDGSDLRSSASVLLELDPSGPDRDRFRATLASFVERAEKRIEDPTEILTPIVDSISALRDDARASGNYQLADELRAILEKNGIEVRDGTDGTEWDLKDRL